MSLCCQIWSDCDQVSVRITAVISPDELSFTWFSINHVLVSNLIIRIFTFTVPQRRNDLHHIFWGAFISSSLDQHRIICLDHVHLILLTHITGDIEWWLIFMGFYCNKDVFIYITSSQNLILSVHINQHLHQFFFKLFNKNIVYKIYRIIEMYYVNIDLYLFIIVLPSLNKI